MAIVVAAAFGRSQRLTGQIEGKARREATHAVALKKLHEGIALLKQGRSAEGLGRLTVAAELDGADAEIARTLQAAEAEQERAACTRPQAAPSPEAAAPPEGAHPSPDAHAIRPAAPRPRPAPEG